ncbi:arabinanase/levansucrase/invertase [Tasmannia lanceolata]|uniref:arabinanase/levansucrase/invertase n=1 Tax=Tasmannia lanceolata TaxID=3420 RepID=UPI0040648D2F
MWYHGNNSYATDSIGLAVSSNGIHWERGNGSIRSSGDAGVVMNCSDDWWAFDTKSIRPSDVLIMSSAKVRASTAVYWLYYTGFSPEEIEFRLNIENPEKFLHNCGNCGFRSLLGLAISQDGRHWARIEGEHHSGALFDVGLDGEWDSLFVAGPKVVYHRSGDLRMYYHSFDVENGCFSIGIARSRDGMRWVKLGKIMGAGLTGSFDEGGVMNGHVVAMKQGGYIMAYEGVGADGRRSIGVAESSDGLKDWRSCGGGEAVLMPQEKGWDNEGVGSPCLVRMDGDDEWRLYYRGIGEGGRTGIGMAVSEGGGVLSFRRWTGFHL